MQAAHHADEVRGTPGPDSPVALRLLGITKRFGHVVANDDVSLEVETGEIHAVLGENGAGKTTLMNVIFGLVRADAGEIVLKGNRLEVDSPRKALSAGIGMVHQHFMLVPNMTVAENVALAVGGVRLTRSDVDSVARRLVELSKTFGLAVEPYAMTEELSVGERQRVEIIKVLYRGADVLILDEPTSSLAPSEWTELAAVLGSLAAHGKSILFITHKLDEVYSVARRATVLRDGRAVGTVNLATTAKPALAEMMVGRKVTMRAARPLRPAGEVVLAVRSLSAVNDDGRDVLSNIDFTVREGEILGIAGVDGNGQRELVDALVGVLPNSRGEVRLSGRHISGPSADQFFLAGGALVPEDRLTAGVVPDLSVADNLMLRRFASPPFSRHGLLNRRLQREHAQRLLERFGVRAADIDQPIRELSGGNQQKVVLARELDSAPQLLVAAQPTRGLDIGSMQDVYRELNTFKLAGGALLLVGTELDEVLSLSDRIAIMVGGRIVRILDAAEANAELLGLLIGGASPEAASAA